MSFEPDVLKLGKEFGAKVQADYPIGWVGMKVQPERPTSHRGRRGFIDLWLEGDEAGKPYPLIIG